MSFQSSLRAIGIWRVGLIALGGLTSIVAGASYLVYASALSPLIVAGAVAAVSLCIAWLQKPVGALYAAIFVVLLPEGLFPDQIHSIINRSTLVIALSTWLLYSISRRRRIVWTGPALLMLGFVFWGTVTLFWTPNLELGLERAIQYALRLILFLVLVVNEIDTKEALDGLMRILALSGWVLVLSGVWTILFAGYEPGTEFAVLRMNMNQFGISILVTMPGVIWQAMHAPPRRKTFAMFLSLVFVLLVIIFVAISGSRGSAISLITTLMVLWIWKPTRTWGRFGMLVIGVAAISAPLIFLTTFERFSEEVGGILGGRIPIWQATWLLISDNFWGGVGIGNASHEVIPYYERLTGIFRGDHRSIHNPVFAIWAETGIPGMLLYLGVLAGAIGIFIRKVRQLRGPGASSLASYSALMSSVFVGVMLSWIKGGGMEYHRTYFLMLALLLIPAHLDFGGVKVNSGRDIRSNRTGR